LGTNHYPTKQLNSISEVISYAADMFSRAFVKVTAACTDLHMKREELSCTVNHSDVKISFWQLSFNFRYLLKYIAFKSGDLLFQLQEHAALMPSLESTNCGLTTTRWSTTDTT
jgi:hypothetical protein